MPFCLVQLTYYLPLNTTDDMILDAISNPEYIFYYMLFGMDLKKFCWKGAENNFDLHCLWSIHTKRTQKPKQHYYQIGTVNIWTWRKFSRYFSFSFGVNRSFYRLEIKQNWTVINETMLFISHILTFHIPALRISKANHTFNTIINTAIALRQGQ